jgi:hypothetical protein
MTPIPVTDRLFLSWDDFNWVVLRKRRQIKKGARPTYHQRYYATLAEACTALLRELPKHGPMSRDLEALIKSVKASEERVLQVLSALEPGDGPTKKLKDTYT